MVYKRLYPPQGFKVSSVSPSSISLSSAEILVGNASNVAQARAMSGDVAIDNVGATTVDFSRMREDSTISSVIAALTPSGAVLPSSGNPTRNDVAGSNFPYKVLDYPDASDTDGYWQFNMPPGIGTDKDIVIRIFWISTATAGDVVWGASVLGRVSGEAYDSALPANTEATTTTAGTAGQVNVTTITINSSGLDAADAAIIRISRNGDDGNDTMTADARLVGADVKWS